MQLENFATPHGQTPQLRYASLHRAVERGLASDDVYKELVDICLRLGHVEEAISVWRRMPHGALRQVLQSQLQRRAACSRRRPATPAAPATAIPALRRSRCTRPRRSRAHRR
ncbi:MAG: hypothetical protein IPK26_30995 [Planctomycetes bacterium]|nr:hypothetical protein [Planctomycetota bacterium]